ncbi:hypothetical protein MIMGU_mgv1a020563mg [Erythranthe guttata]|uniref:Uncharacterized protein n=1 Tax=Erythranthe guttata TaxID=4155 RepID=A0A022RE33_ERYGU|nr:PREDICTED: uncharacterized protein LOC105956768 [Erythranthe guttata]EYU38637.1 hypothetical protein MIMGU_mgv1a020563mg [Erythranthe guttata]|eukprot:XP_012836119.1 PREDICTED: uncharacterized protein LOC105956768 [Erythranthe guttata]
MGNCLVLEEKIVRVMKTDGKILEYKSPIKVHQILSEFSNHAISDKLPVLKHLHLNTEMVQNHLYYLLPLPPPIKTTTTTKTKKKKTVRFSDDVIENHENRATGSVVRIKLVISKKELQAMLINGGVSVDDLISNQVQKEESTNGRGVSLSPALESIPEVN